MNQVEAEAKYETRKLAQLQEWDENPRSIDKADFERLKDQIIRLGVYKPLLINQSNIIIGGNMRYNALKELGVEEVMCAVVLTDNKAQMIEYALSDNEHMGTTDTQKLAELVTINPIKVELFNIPAGKLKPLQTVLDNVSPDPKPKVPKVYECPECGHQNDLSAFEVRPE